MKKCCHCVLHFCKPWIGYTFTLKTYSLEISACHITSSLDTVCMSRFSLQVVIVVPWNVKIAAKQKISVQDHKMASFLRGLLKRLCRKLHELKRVSGE